MDPSAKESQGSMSASAESMVLTAIPRAARTWVADRKVFFTLEDEREISFPAEECPRFGPGS